MEAKEAPEKIYLTKNLLGELRDGWDAQPSEVFTNIEYTRTDAFIKRIHKLLSSRIDYIPYYHDKTEFVNEIIEDISGDIE